MKRSYAIASLAVTLCVATILAAEFGSLLGKTNRTSSSKSENTHLAVPRISEAQREREQERKSAPSLSKVESLAGDWRIVIVDCDPQRAVNLAGKSWLWKVYFRMPDSDYSQAFGFGETLEDASRNAISDYRDRIAEAVHDEIKRNKDRSKVQQEVKGCCK